MVVYGCCCSIRLLPFPCMIPHLTETTGLALRLEQDEDIALTDWALNVTDDRTVGLIHELDADLSWKKQDWAQQAGRANHDKIVSVEWNDDGKARSRPMSILL